MGEAFITRRGGAGGGGQAYGYIVVVYPAGSICTCTNGTKTFTAKDTSGQWVFSVPTAGNWTVTATDGSKTASKTVAITSPYQGEKVKLSYALAFIENGFITDAATFSSDSSPFTQTQFTNPDYYQLRVAALGYHSVYTTSPVLVTHPIYHIKLQTASNGFQKMAIWNKNTTPSYNNTAAIIGIPNQATEAVLNISSFVGSECYIGFASEGGLQQDLITMELYDGET